MSTQAPVRMQQGRPNSALPILDLDHLNRLLKIGDRGKLERIAGGNVVFQCYDTEEEGNRQLHEVVIFTQPATNKAFWHNGHVAQLRLDGEPVSRKQLRKMLILAEA